MDKKKKQKVLSLLAFSVGLLLALVFVSLSSISSTEKRDNLEGIEQRGALLGNPETKTTLLYFGDLRCPICASFSNNTLPKIIDELVRPGKINIEYKNWATLGPESELAARGALAAGEQNYLWNFIEEFYSQSPQSAEGVDDESLQQIAKEAGVPSISRWQKDLDKKEWDSFLRSNATEAKIFLKFQGTPSFAVKNNGGPPKVLSSNANSSASDFIRELESEISE